MHPTNRLRQFAASAALALAFLLSARGGHAAICTGDCDGDGTVSIAELTTGVTILLDQNPGSSCTAMDEDHDSLVEVHELIAAVRRALDGCPAYPLDDTLRLNQIQVVGSHNSYHIRPSDKVFDQINLVLGPDVGQVLVDSLSYDHPPLTEQFDEQGVRQIELDVWADPDGGLFASPLGFQLDSDDPTARIPELEAPGFKVFHVQDIDYRSECRTLVECLQEVKAWSAAHPQHMPLMIQIEAKDDEIPDIGGFHFITPVKIGTAELDALDAEIRSVFSAEQLITPDDVRGDNPTLKEAILRDGWPTLGASRGRVLFCLDNEGKRTAYLEGHPSLQGRVMFTPAPADADDTAFRKLNDSVADFAEIQAAVRAGFVVRTRSDADTTEARQNNTVPRDRAFESGAQWVSTDYPVETGEFGNDFVVRIPDGMPARCNPLIAPAECTASDIEDPAHLSE